MHILGVHPLTLWKWTCPRGDLPCVKMGRLIRYRPQDLEKWLEKKLGGTRVTINTEKLRVEEKQASKVIIITEENLRAR